MMISVGGTERSPCALSTCERRAWSAVHFSFSFSCFCCRGAFAQGEATEPTAHIVGVSVFGNRYAKERIILREMVFQDGDTMPSSEFYTKLENAVARI